MDSDVFMKRVATTTSSGTHSANLTILRTIPSTTAFGIQEANPSCMSTITNAVFAFVGDIILFRRLFA